MCTPQGHRDHSAEFPEDLPDPPARAARPSPHSTDPASHPHLTAPPNHQPATLRPALRTTGQARLTSTDPPRHHARPRHTAPQRATVHRTTARRDATRHRAAQHDTTDPNLRDYPKPATAHPGRRRASTPHTSTAGHTRGHSAPGDNGGGPPRRIQPAPQRGKDTNNPSPLTQNHKHPPGAAAQPAEPGPNPARRGAEPTVYIAHPTHGAGTRPHRTQLKTTARKTTLNAGQCVRQPREGRGRNRQAPPPQKKKEGGGGKGTKTAHSRQTARQHHHRRPNPPPEGTEDRTPTEAQGDHPPKTGNTKPVTAAHGEKGHRNGKKRKGEPPAQPERKGMEGQGPPSPKKNKKKNKRKKKAQKTHPDNPAKKGWAQPRPGPNTHAHTARQNRKRRGASGAPTKPHTSQKQAETEAQPRKPQTADTRGTTPQTVPKHTHPRPQPGLARLTKPTPNRQPDPNTNAAQQ